MARRNERGSGLVGSFFGAIVFLAFLSLATHTLISLYATSVVTASAWDEARHVATNAEISDTRSVAEASLREDLNGFENLTLEWQQDNNGSLGLAVGVDRPMLLPRALAKTTKLDRIERTVWIRSEELR